MNSVLFSFANEIVRDAKLRIKFLLRTQIFRKIFIVLHAKLSIYRNHTPVEINNFLLDIYAIDNSEAGFH